MPMSGKGHLMSASCVFKGDWGMASAVIMPSQSGCKHTAPGAARIWGWSGVEELFLFVLGMLLKKFDDPICHQMACHGSW